MLAKEKGTRAISLRVSIADIDAAKEIAGNGEVRYPTVLTEPIRYCLKKRGA